MHGILVMLVQVAAFPPSVSPGELLAPERSSSQVGRFRECAFCHLRDALLCRRTVRVAPAGWRWRRPRQWHAVAVSAYALADSRSADRARGRLPSRDGRPVSRAPHFAPAMGQLAGLLT